MKISKITLFGFLFTACFFVLLYDIGNPDALRQGTEGFYLKISKEMFQANSFFTPIINGAPHWSKPPLQFWLTWPAYILTGGTSLFAARITILLFSFTMLLGFTSFVKRYCNISQVMTFMTTISMLGFIKYSRIYMMESMLSLLGAAAIFSFYHYYKNPTYRNLFASSILLALSILVKGHVTLVMGVTSVTLFLVYEYFVINKPRYKKVFLWGTFALILSSFWFIISYINYGMEFINYFFLRENLGKFSTKVYPVTSVIQGLFIYGAPISLFAPLLFTRRFINRFKKDDLTRLLTFSFLVFFFIWFIPTQRSHHYAIPSLPFFYLLIIRELKFLKFDSLTSKLLWGGTRLLYSVPVILLSILSFGKYFQELSTSEIYITIGVLFFLLLVSFIKNITTRAFSFFGITVIFYIFIAPKFILPALPAEAKELIGNKEISVIYRKPYFIEEALGRKVEILNHSEFATALQKEKPLLILEESIPLEQKNNIIILKSWDVWRRGSSFDQILNSLKIKNSNSLKEKMLLIIKK